MERNFKKSFGTRVRYLRKLAGLSQEQVAESTGLSTKTISYIENSKNTLSFNKLPLLAKALGVPVYKLFVFADSENNKEVLDSLLSSATDKEINAIDELFILFLTVKILYKGSNGKAKIKLQHVMIVNNSNKLAF